MTTMILGLLHQALCQALMKLQLRGSPPAPGQDRASYYYYPHPTLTKGGSEK